MSVAAILDDYLDGLLAADRAAAPAAPTAQPAAALAAPEAASTPAHEPLPAVGPTAKAAPVAMAAAPGAGDAVPAAEAAEPQAQVEPPAAPAPPLARAPARPAAPAARRPPVPATPPPPVVPPAHAARLAAPADDALARRAADRSSRWLRLRCAHQRYGLELLKVQEVVLPVPLLALRGTPAAMLGVMNLRGQVVPVLDLGMHLGQAAQPTTPATRFVVLEEKGEVLGLRVSAVEDVVNLGDHQVEPPTTQVRRSDDGLFRGIARQGGEPMVLLDASCLLASAGHGDRR